MTTNQDLINALAPILAAAKQKDPRIFSICVIYDNDPCFGGKPLFISFSGGNALEGQGRAIESALDSVNAYDPEAERAAKLLDLENQANSIREQIRNEQQQNNAK